MNVQKCYKLPNLDEEISNKLNCMKAKFQGKTFAEVQRARKKASKNHKLQKLKREDSQ
jgi:hypothetical protein